MFLIYVKPNLPKVKTVKSFPEPLLESHQAETNSFYGRPTVYTPDRLFQMLCKPPEVFHLSSNHSFLQVASICLLPIPCEERIDASRTRSIWHIYFPYLR